MYQATATRRMTDPGRALRCLRVGGRLGRYRLPYEHNVLRPVSVALVCLDGPRDVQKRLLVYSGSNTVAGDQDALVHIDEAKVLTRHKARLLQPHEERVGVVHRHAGQ